MNKLGDHTIKMKKKGSVTNKVISTVMTMLVIGLLIFVGPVDAYSLQIDGLRNGAYNTGEIINFIGSIDIEPEELVNIQNVSLEVNNQIVCTFDIHGTNITPCDGIDISLVSNTAQFGYGYGYGNFIPGWNGNNNSANAGQWEGYGFGYGYGYVGGEFDGELVYNISIHTPQPYFHFGGNNRIKLITHTGTQTLNSRAENIAINPQIVGTGNGNFLMGYGQNGGDAIFWGRFNSNDHSMVGEVQWMGSSFRMVGVGSYTPMTPTSGDISIRFYNPSNTNDAGMIWTGTYSGGTWSIHHENATLSGPLFIPPQ